MYKNCKMQLFAAAAAFSFQSFAAKTETQIQFLEKQVEAVSYKCLARAVEILERFSDKPLEDLACLSEEQKGVLLLFAAKRDDAHAIKALRDAGVNLRFKDEAGNTALHYAAENGSITAAAILAGYEDVKNNKGNTSLPAAAASGEKEMAALIIDLPNNKGATALHIAAEIGNAEIAKLLLEKGADPNVQKKNGQTPLIQLIYPFQSEYLEPQRRIEIIRLLLENGADPNVQTANGQTAAYYAIQNYERSGGLEAWKSKEIAELFLQSEANLITDFSRKRNFLHAAARQDAIVWIEAGKNNLPPAAMLPLINAQDEAGNTALHYAAENGSIKMIEILEEMGFDAADKNNQGLTALDFAKGRFRGDERFAASSSKSVGYFVNAACREIRKRNRNKGVYEGRGLPSFC